MARHRSIGRPVAAARRAEPVRLNEHAAMPGRVSEQKDDRSGASCGRLLLPDQRFVIGPVGDAGRGARGDDRTGESSSQQQGWLPCRVANLADDEVQGHQLQREEEEEAPGPGAPRGSAPRASLPHRFGPAICGRGGAEG